jgi:GTP cyclohydrolase II
MVNVKTKIALKIGSKSQIQVEIASFSHLTSEKEHIAIIFKKADEKQTSPLVRIHSECLTGDVFHSSRCDCGEQLDEAINIMEEEGGVILYLRQEGRGIGLYNKIEAYKLQSQGLNTYQANNQLGFEDDQRGYYEAGQMLAALNIHTLKLFTNNPLKVESLREYGINIEKVIRTSTHIKEDNADYLKAKAVNADHNLNLC